MVCTFRLKYLSADSVEASIIFLALTDASAIITISRKDGRVDNGSMDHSSANKAPIERGRMGLRSCVAIMDQKAWSHWMPPHVYETIIVFGTIRFVADTGNL